MDIKLEDISELTEKEILMRVWVNLRDMNQNLTSLNAKVGQNTETTEKIQVMIIGDGKEEIGLVGKIRDLERDQTDLAQKLIGLETRVSAAEKSAGDSKAASDSIAKSIKDRDKLWSVVFSVMVSPVVLLIIYLLWGVFTGQISLVYK